MKEEANRKCLLNGRLASYCCSMCTPAIPHVADIFRFLFPKHCSSLSDLRNAILEAVNKHKQSAALEVPYTIDTTPSSSASVTSLVSCSKPVSSTTTTSSSHSAAAPPLDSLTTTVNDVLSRIEKHIKVPTGFTFRLASASDVHIIYSLVQDLAVYEKAPDAVITTPDVLLRDGWGESRPYFYAILVEEEAVPVGMALFYPIYSTWTGKALYLEDLFVREVYRGRGVGTSLLRLVACIAHAACMSRFQFQCLDWNKPSLDLYTSLGASALSEWVTLRFEGQQLATFATSGLSSGNNKKRKRANSENSAWSAAFQTANKVMRNHESRYLRYVF